MHWDSINLVIFGISATLLSIYLFRKVATMENQSDEIGSALLVFGKAFPGEPVRDVQPTADAGAVFLRLSDGNTGYIQAFKKHVVCQILKPGSVSVQPSDGDNVIHLEFGDNRLEDGDFRFKDARQAAEVSLWLLGSFAAAGTSGETLNPA